jgi:hypothetical protein
MKGRCGNDEHEGPEQLIKLQIDAGALSIEESGRAFYYNVKCTGNRERSLWTHNGSIMYLVADGQKRRFYYREPRSAMLEAGARPDSLLFEGNSDGSRYHGTAFVFSRCGQFRSR